MLVREQIELIKLVCKAVDQSVRFASIYNSNQLLGVRGRRGLDKPLLDCLAVIGVAVLRENDGPVPYEGRNRFLFLYMPVQILSVFALLPG